VAGYLFVILGEMPVATKGNPRTIEQSLAKKGLDAAIGKEAWKPSPPSADEANLLAGARVYQQAQCWVCHGQLGSAIGRDSVSDDLAAVVNGVWIGGCPAGSRWAQQIIKVVKLAGFSILPRAREAIKPCSVSLGWWE
jgi:hypothetical protein